MNYDILTCSSVPPRPMIAKDISVATIPNMNTEKMYIVKQSATQTVATKTSR